MPIRQPFNDFSSRTDAYLLIQTLDVDRYLEDLCLVSRGTAPALVAVAYITMIQLIVAQCVVQQTLNGKRQICKCEWVPTKMVNVAYAVFSTPTRDESDESVLCGCCTRAIAV